MVKKNCYNENSFSKIFRQAHVLRAEILWILFFMSSILKKDIKRLCINGKSTWEYFVGVGAADAAVFPVQITNSTYRPAYLGEMNDLYETNGLQLIRKVFWNWLVFVFFIFLSLTCRFFFLGIFLFSLSE